MAGRTAVERALTKYTPNQIFFSGQLYRQFLSDQMSEAAFHKVIERMCETGSLSKVAKGTYCKTKYGKYGKIAPSTAEIVAGFTENKTGTTVGYDLYNDLRLTTQIGKQVNVLTSNLEQTRRSIGAVSLARCPLTFDSRVASMVHMLEVLQNFQSIQDLNIRQFLCYASKFAVEYDDEVFETVYKARRYPKHVIAFLAEILDYYKIPHSLHKHLSSLSNYKHPRMEELYEAARI